MVASGCQTRSARAIVGRRGDAGRERGDDVQPSLAVGAAADGKTVRHEPAGPRDRGCSTMRALMTVNQYFRTL